MGADAGCARGQARREPADERRAPQTGEGWQEKVPGCAPQILDSEGQRGFTRAAEPLRVECYNTRRCSAGACNFQIYPGQGQQNEDCVRVVCNFCPEVVDLFFEIAISKQSESSSRC